VLVLTTVSLILPTDRRRGDNYGLHSRLLYSCVQFATCALSVSQITQLDLRIIRPSTTNPPRDHSFTLAKVPVQFDSIRIGFRSISVIVSAKMRLAFKLLKDMKCGNSSIFNRAFSITRIIITALRNMSRISHNTAN